MADEEHRIRLDVEGNAASELDKVASSSDKATKSANKLKKSTDDQSESFKALDEILGITQLGYAAMAAAVLGALKAMYDAAKGYAAQQASLGRLNRSIRQAGGTYQDFQRSSDAARQASSSLGIELLEVQAAQQTLFEATGSVSQAEQDFALALDVSAASGEDLKDVTKDLAEARRGEFEGLKKYVGFNKEAVEALVAQSDAGNAAAEAFDRLKESYGGSAEGLKGLDDDLKSLGTRAENLKTSLGGVVANMARLAASGDDTGVGSVVGAFEKGFAELADLTDAAAELAEGMDDVAKLEIGRLGMAVKSGEIELTEALQLMKDVRGRMQDRAEPSAGGGPEEEFVGPAPLTEDERLKRVRAMQLEREKKAEEAKKDAKRRAEERIAAEQDVALREKRIEILQAEGEETVRLLEYEYELLEIKHQKLTAEQQALANTEAEIKLQQDLAEIEKSRQEEFDKGVIEQQGQYYKTLMEQQKKADAEDKALAEQRAKREAEYQELLNQRQEANQANMNALTASAKGAADVASIFIENERAQAAIQGAIAAAEATAAFAGGNIPGGIGFTAAAAQFFAVAGGAGQGNSAPATAAASSSRTRSFEDRAGTQRAGMVAGQPGNTTVQYVFNSGFAPSPRHARQIADETERARRTGTAGEVR